MPDQTNKQKVSIEIPKVYLFSCSRRLLSSVCCDKERQIKQTKKETNKQTNKQNVTREIPKVYLFSCSRRLLSSAHCDKESQIKQTNKQTNKQTKSI
jgi:hypothetical protein